MTQTLVAGALEQSGWAPQTEVEVMSDGAKGMRSLVEAVAPTLAKRNSPTKAVIDGRSVQMSTRGRSKPNATRQV
jgi:hypothetical protein